MGELIAIISGKGGTGKTSVCAGIATALASEGKRVLCIDCDIGLRNLDISLAMADCGSLSFLDIMDGDCDFHFASENPYYSGLFFLTAPVNYSASEIDLEKFSFMLKKASEEFDYVFLDAPAGIDEGFQVAARFASRMILVTGADPAAMRDAGRAGQILDIMGKRDVRLVVNRVKRKMISDMNLTIDDVMDRTGIPLLGVVPEDKNIPYAANASRPLLLYGTGRKGAGRAFLHIAKRLDGIPTPLSVL